MKKKTIRTIAVALSTCIAVSAVTYGVQKSSMVAQAEETLFGIEQLIQEVQDKGRTYTILEVVPEKDAAEIGYWIPGYEPALSEWNETTGRWTSWQEGLKQYTTYAERTAYINGLKDKWDTFRNQYGFSETDAPVTYSPYTESENGGEDYNQLAFDTAYKTGYFLDSQYVDATGAGTERYSLSFIRINALNDDIQLYMGYATAVTADVVDGLDTDTPLYRLPDGGVYTYVETWGELWNQISASSSVSGGDASGGNAGMTEAEKLDYYKTHFDEINAEMELPELYIDVHYRALPYPLTGVLDTNTVYAAVGEIRADDNGQYVFKQEEGRTQYAFSTNNAYYKGGFENQEWFRQKVLNMDADKVGTFAVQVITVTPGMLNRMYNETTDPEDPTKGFPKFDLLYINSGLAAGHMTYGTADVADLSQDAMLELFATVVSGESACILDANILYDTINDTTNPDTVALTKRTELETTNLFYLCMLLSQNTPSEHSYDDGETDIGDLWDSMYEDADHNFVVENVYSFVTPKKLLSTTFLTPSIFHEGADEEQLEQGFAAVKTTIDTENEYRQADTATDYEPLSLNISQATVVRHVINYRYRRSTEPKKTIRVLEIEPCMSDTISPDLTEDQVRKWVKDGDKVERVEITRMTTAEFIGVIEDINEKYDLVYIGTDKDHMNVSDNTTYTTVFNDTLMNGLIYYHTGDRRYVAMELAGMLDSEYVNSDRNNDVYYYVPVRYGGNDITEEKEKALLSFLDASYPIVVSDEFFRKPVTVYQHTNYNKEDRGGYSCNLDVGTYDLGQLNSLGVRNDDVTSIKVKEGYEAILYWDSGFSGASRTVNTNVGYLDGGWNDQVSSMEVRAIEGAERTREIDADHIDDSSYMYEFVQKAMERPNFYAKSDISEGSELFNFYLNKPKVSVTNLAVTHNRMGGEKGDIYCISPNSRGRYLLEYSFMIQNEGAASSNTQYSCDLLIDVNADGKYSDSESVSNDMSITWNGQSVDPNALYAGRRYTLSRVVPDGYKGVLPWKIQIKQVNNSNIHTSVMGYTKMDGLEKEVINILQVCRDKIDTPNWWGGDREVLFNLSSMIDDPGNVYHTLIYGNNEYPGIADQFEIKVTFKTIRQLENEYTEGYLDNYNMLILGFSDAYGDFKETYNAQGELTGALGGIVDFITSGKSVLFAHDSMGYYNYDEELPNNGRHRVGVIDRTMDLNTERNAATTFLNSIDWNGRYYRYDRTGDVDRYVSVSNQYRSAYNLTNQLRGLVGMDVYGVKELAALRTGIGLESSDTTGAWDTVIKYGKDVPYQAKSARTATVPETQGFTYAIINAKDVNISTGVQGVFSAKETLPSDNGWTNTYLNLYYGTVHYHDWSEDNGEIHDNYNGEVDNLLVEKVNSGQITDYPYKLDDQFMVSTTHNQYYQLDFTADDDNDGQSDLVVWFCLGGRVTGDGVYQDTIYSVSPRDVSNNYYIYNKGNITYTGVGHAGASGGTTVDEAKLFINTMIASYNAGIKAPTVSVLSEGNADSAELRGVNSYYDDDNSLSFSSNNGTNATSGKKLYFTVSDVNFVNGTRSIRTNFYYVSTGEGTQALQVVPPTADTAGTTVNVKQMNNMKIYAAKDNREVANGNLESGGIYYIYVDDSVIQSELEASGSPVFTLYIEAQTFINKKGLNGVTVPVSTDPSYTRFDFTRVSLFNLE